MVSSVRNKKRLVRVDEDMMRSDNRQRGKGVQQRERLQKHMIGH